MTTPLRKLRVSDAEWNAWKTAAPNGNVSGWLRSLANAALAEASEPLRTSEPESSEPLGTSEPARAVRIHAPRRDPEWLRREAALLATLSEKE